MHGIEKKKKKKKGAISSELFYPVESRFHDLLTLVREAVSYTLHKCMTTYPDCQNGVRRSSPRVYFGAAGSLAFRVESYGGSYRRVPRELNIVR